VVSFTHRPLYHRGKSSRCSLDRRLGGPQNRCGRGGEEKKFLLLQVSKPGHQARCLVTILTETSRLGVFYITPLKEIGGGGGVAVSITRVGVQKDTAIHVLGGALA
jgi:hypothetical protein